MTTACPRTLVTSYQPHPSDPDSTCRGSGLVEVAYADAQLRVFRAPGTGSVTVQARRRGLDRLLGPRWRPLAEETS